MPPSNPIRTTRSCLRLSSRRRPRLRVKLKKNCHLGCQRLIWMAIRRRLTIQTTNVVLDEDYFATIEGPVERIGEYCHPGVDERGEGSTGDDRSQ